MRGDALIARSRIAFVRFTPAIAEQPEPGSRLLHGVAVSRKYGQRVRCRMLPPIVAMLRSWPDAASRSDWLTNGYRSRTWAFQATSLMRASPPNRSPPPGNSLTAASDGSLPTTVLMSMSIVGCSTPSFMRSTSVVPPAIKRDDSADAARTALSTSAATT